MPQLDDHRTAKERFPSESSREAIVSTGSLPSGETKRGVPTGTQSPLALNMRQPTPLGTAPKSRRNEMRVSNSTSAWG